ncbi:MAG: dockerin type I repeat-containing protein, partial [Nanoarchaeota archaeon]
MLKRGEIITKLFVYILFLIIIGLTSTTAQLGQLGKLGESAESKDICPIPECAVPPAGCRYEPGKSTRGCPTCGKLVCEKPICGNGICEAGEACPQDCISCKPGRIIGDVDGDGIITNYDGNLTLRVVVGLLKQPPNICCIDVTQDGTISSLDATRILQISQGIIKSPGVCNPVCGNNICEQGEDEIIGQTNSIPPSYII